jgi:hypothetical protein
VLVNSVRSTGYGDLPVVKNFSMWNVSGSKNRAPGGIGSTNHVLCGFGSPATRTAAVMSAT